MPDDARTQVVPGVQHSMTGGVDEVHTLAGNEDAWIDPGKVPLEQLEVGGEVVHVVPGDPLDRGLSVDPQRDRPPFIKVIDI